MVLDGKITCPFCFEKFNPQDVHLRCINPLCTGTVEDTKYANARAIPPRKDGHVFGIEKADNTKTTGTPHSSNCPVCYKASDTRLCPECHFELSHDIGQIPQRIIAVVGGRHTGKSHYIAAVISALRNEVGENLKLAVRLLGDETQIRWEQDFYRPLFERKNVLSATQPGLADARVKVPLALRFTSHGGLVKQIFNVSIFDSSGEDMTTTRTLTVQAGSLAHADGIVFMIDPLQLDSVCQQLFNRNATGVDPQAHPERILERLIELFERRHGLHLLSRFGVGNKINVPIAIAVSKIDTLASIIDPSSPLNMAGEHHNALNLTDAQSVSTEVSRYLRKWVGANFCNNIESSFSHFQYFGVSSLGHQPDAQHPVVTSPLRVEDPFLWLLYKTNLIKGKKIR